MSSAPLKILLVEDDEDDYILVRTLLSEVSPSRFHLDWVKTYEAAVDEILKGRHDVYLLDYQLGQRNGLELLGEVGEKGFLSPIIFLTGQGDYAVDTEAMKAGVSDYLVKGQISAHALERSIRYAIERKQVEKELRGYRDHLEELVRERTAQLENVNAQLRREISERSKVEEALSESQRHISTLLSNLTGMAYRCRNDQDWTMEFVSDGSLDLTGYAPSDLLENKATSYARLIDPEDRERVWNEVQTALQEKRPFRLVYRIVCRSGERKWVWEQGRGVWSPSGELLALEGFITDMTDHKRAEDALKESEARHRTVVESSSDAILVIDADRRIVSFNQAFLNLFGFDRNDIEGKSTRIFHTSEESYHAFVAAAGPELERVGSFRSEWELMRKDGVIVPVEETMSAIRNADGSIRGYVAIIRDITERKRTEEELEQYRDHLEEMVLQRTRELETAQKALIQKEKLKTLGAISAEVAHEIRNPLVSIGGFAKRLQKKYPDLPEAGIIVSESRRLEIILNRIKNYLRPIEMRPQVCSVNAILTESVDLLAPELERDRVAWRLDLDPNLPPAYVDPGVLTQVFINVIKNALKDMNKEGTLVIKTLAHDRNIQIDFRNPVQGAKVKDPELLLMPFDEGGHAIAMPLCFRLLRDMGGVLSFTQEKDHVVFSVTIAQADRKDPMGEERLGEAS